MVVLFFVQLYLFALLVKQLEFQIFTFNVLGLNPILFGFMYHFRLQEIDIYLNTYSNFTEQSNANSTSYVDWYYSRYNWSENILFVLRTVSELIFIRVGLKSYIKLFASVHWNGNEISFRSAENIIYIWRKCHGLVLIDLISTLISLQQCEESRVSFILCWGKKIFHASIYATVWYRVYI